MTRSHADPDIEGLLGFRPEARARPASSTGGGLRRAEAHGRLSINEETSGQGSSGPGTDRGDELLWPLWAAAAHGLIVLFLAAPQTTWALAKLFHMPRDGFSICAWLGINGILFVTYVWLIRRGVEAARYANR